jgi:hypothetical protein
MGQSWWCCALDDSFAFDEAWRVSLRLLWLCFGVSKQIWTCCEELVEFLPSLYIVVSIGRAFGDSSEDVQMVIENMALQRNNWHGTL